MLSQAVTPRVLDTDSGGMTSRAPQARRNSFPWGGAGEYRRAWGARGENRLRNAA